MSGPVQDADAEPGSPVDPHPVDPNVIDQGPMDPPDEQAWLSNAGSLVAGRLMVAILGWAGTIVIARTLDQEAFGQFTFVFGLLGMMAIATDLGLGRIALSGVMPGVDDAGAFAGSYVVLRCGLGLVGYGLALGFTIVAGYPSEIVQATAIAGAVVILATASHAYELVLQANLRLGIVAISAVIGRTAQLALTAAIAVAGGSLLWFLVPAIVAEVVIGLVKVPRSLRLLSMSYHVRPRLWLKMLGEAVPISLGTALATLYFRVDSIMLSKLDDFTAVAIYGVAFKFIDLLHFLSLSIAIPLLTVLVKAWPNDLKTFRTTVRRTIALFAVLAGALLVHFGLFATETIELLYGSTYRSGGVAVQLLLVGEVIGFCSIIGLTVLTASANHRRYPLIALAGLVTNIALNLWAIPRWSFEGAAAATIATEVVVVVAMLVLIHRIPDLPGLALYPALLALGPIAAGVLAGVLAQMIAPWPVAAFAAFAFYGGVAAISGLAREAGGAQLIGRGR